MQDKILVNTKSINYNSCHELVGPCTLASWLTAVF